MPITSWAFKSANICVDWPLPNAKSTHRFSDQSPRSRLTIGIVMCFKNKDELLNLL